MEPCQVGRHERDGEVCLLCVGGCMTRVIEGEESVCDVMYICAK